ncbi:hypothetical protein I312_103599 [Cryptococcus bacillisporus CA1280]|uniref:uncharacterized protein n=1 Tax=Cryptococcus bacillisporus CA1280 TaxID=1296109 RepID=UPI00336732D5
MPGYYDGESVSGRVGIRLKDGRKFQHDGIRIELIGNIELFYDKKNHYEFAQSFEFTLKNVEKQFESYAGINVRLRYYIRMSFNRVVKQREFWMEVGIEDCLHIEFEHNKAK